MPTTEAQKKATLKYMKENLEKIEFRVQKGEKEKIKNYAQNKGKSLSAYIIDLVKKDMERGEQ